MAKEAESTWTWSLSQVRRTSGGEKPDTLHRSQGAALDTVRTWTVRLLGAEAAARRSLVMRGPPGALGEAGRPGSRTEERLCQAGGGGCARRAPSLTVFPGGRGGGLTVFLGSCGHHLGSHARAAQRAGDVGPRGPGGHGQVQAASQALGTIGILLQRPTVHTRVQGRPGHLPGQAGLLKASPHCQAGEGGLSLEPWALQGRLWQVEAGRAGVVPTLCQRTVASVTGGTGARGPGLGVVLWAVRHALSASARPAALPGADPAFVASWPPATGPGACSRAGLSPGLPNVFFPFFPALCPRALTSETGVRCPFRLSGLRLGAAGGRHCGGRWGDRLCAARVVGPRPPWAPQPSCSLGF